tara:strand:+ start:32 stop:226 length:195 start_codon:yes stop_codon:yes gene_type:complete
MNEYQARKYWESNYNDEEIKRLEREWGKIEDELSQPENINLNLERRQVEAWEKIADVILTLRKI